jgi:hypothetical protein
LNCREVLVHDAGTAMNVYLLIKGYMKNRVNWYVTPASVTAKTGMILQKE